MTPSVGHRSPTRRDGSDLSKSPIRGRRSPRTKSPSQRERSPARHRNSPTTRSSKEKLSSRGRSPKRPKSKSPAPHRKRLKHADEEDVDEIVPKEHGEYRSRERGREHADQDRPRERGIDLETLRDRSERRSGRDKKVGERGIDRDTSLDRSERRSARDKKEGEKGIDPEALIDRSERRSARDKKEGGKGRDQEASVDRSERRSERDKKEMERVMDREASFDRSERRSGRDKKEVEGVIDRQASFDRSERRSARDKKEGERGIDREASFDRSERRSARDKKEGDSSRSRHKRSTSPMDRDRSRPISGSPTRASRRRTHDEVNDPHGDDNRDDNDSVARMKAAEEALETKKKEQPSFELSGKLAAETNRVKGVTLLFNEPPEARKPDVRWRLYVFKAGEVLNDPLYIHRQTCYLFGRERRVADVPTDHPSCSKQHAVIQFRQIEKEQPDGMLSKQSRVCGLARELSLSLIFAKKVGCPVTVPFFGEHNP
ncbi:hypothetical protein AQUCO_04700122v1 [Aquilegia coerulea]|uniref:FHA domain-containing protein n=1 Tax=Aquilegia coerulea TaxID=218851 RepID=A0A2G5CL69_AQUCA|nr:hypothetical protein AQUCO_04700122v1 [Aquilegia coerulea]